LAIAGAPVQEAPDPCLPPVEELGVGVAVALLDENHELLVGSWNRRRDRCSHVPALRRGPARCDTASSSAEARPLARGRASTVASATIGRPLGPAARTRGRASAQPTKAAGRGWSNQVASAELGIIGAGARPLVCSPISRSPSSRLSCQATRVL